MKIITDLYIAELISILELKEEESKKIVKNKLNLLLNVPQTRDELLTARQYVDESLSILAAKEKY